MSYLASFSTSKLQKKPSPTCLLVSQSLAAPVLVCHLRLGAPLLTSALISRAPCGGRVSEKFARLRQARFLPRLSICIGALELRPRTEVEA
jgi:hypothetical protein